MLVDLLALVLILEARNGLAMKQFLEVLTSRRSRPEGCPPSVDLPKVLLLKGTALVPGSKEWVLGLY